MQTKKRHPWIAFLSFLLFFILFLLHYTDAIDLSIHNAQPLALLPLLTAFSIFAPPGKAATAGLLLGICMDGAASSTYCFHAAVMMLTAAAVSVVSTYLFNRNIRSALLLSFLTSLVYYALRWLVFYAFSGSVQSSLTYLLSYALPSVLYTFLFIIPFYFLYKYFYQCRKGD